MLDIAEANCTLISLLCKFALINFKTSNNSENNDLKIIKRQTGAGEEGGGFEKRYKGEEVIYYNSIDGDDGYSNLPLPLIIGMCGIAISFVILFIFCCCPMKGDERCKHQYPPTIQQQKQNGRIAAGGSGTMSKIRKQSEDYQNICQICGKRRRKRRDSSWLIWFAWFYGDDCCSGADCGGDDDFISVGID